MRTEGRAPMMISTVTPWLALRVYRETSVEMQMGGEVWCLHRLIMMNTCTCTSAFQHMGFNPQVTAIMRVSLSE